MASRCAAGGRLAESSLQLRTRSPGSTVDVPTLSPVARERMLPGKRVYVFLGVCAVAVVVVQAAIAPAKIPHLLAGVVIGLVVVLVGAALWVSFRDDDVW